MNDKSALIVDDSRTAQLILQKMLEKQHLRVDTADSAEAAIEYLTRHAPDAIFMDHMMPGMDGFQAIEVIKQNPRTATIPIVMYTSKGGELYVSQARALGAVGVLPKDVRSAELNRVLQQLHLATGAGESDPVATSGEGAIAGNDANAQVGGSHSRPTSAAVALTDITVHRLARATADAIRLPDSTLALQEELRSLRKEMRHTLEASISGLQREISSDVRIALDAAEVRRAEEQGQPPGRLRWIIAALCAGLLGGTLLGSAFTGTAVEEGDHSARFERQSEELAALNAENSRLQGLLETQTASAKGDSQPGWLSALSWAFNSSQSNDFNEVPLDDHQLERVSGLIERLHNAGFRGSAVLDVHLGDFCLRRITDGTLHPPADDTPFNDCTQLGFESGQAQLLSGRQSIAFANFIASSPLLDSSGIDLEINPLGNSEPRAAYPNAGSVATAGEWNRAARQNQRIELRLMPEADK